MKSVWFCERERNGIWMHWMCFGFGNVETKRYKKHKHHINVGVNQNLVVNSNWMEAFFFFSFLFLQLMWNELNLTHSFTGGILSPPLHFLTFMFYQFNLPRNSRTHSFLSLFFSFFFLVTSQHKYITPKINFWSFCF